MPVVGQMRRAPAGCATVADGWHDLALEKVVPVLERDGHTPKLSDGGKEQVDAFVTVDADHARTCDACRGSHVVAGALRRRFAVTLNPSMSGNGKPSNFAAFLSACTGIKDDDRARLELVDTDDLGGVMLRVKTRFKSTTGYCDIVDQEALPSHRPERDRAAERVDDAARRRPPVTPADPAAQDLPPHRVDRPAPPAPAVSAAWSDEQRAWWRTFLERERSVITAEDVQAELKPFAVRMPQDIATNVDVRAFLAGMARRAKARRAA